MSQIIPIYIPTYINSAQYSPARVLPRLFFYNGLLDCEPWYIEAFIPGPPYSSIQSTEFTSFPYFDNYNTFVSNSAPTANNLSDTNLVAPYKLTGLLALSVERATIRFTF